MNFERKWCHECSGIQLFGEHKGKACCSAMSRILKNRETGEPEDDRRTADGQTEEQPKNGGKIVVMERATAQA